MTSVRRVARRAVRVLTGSGAASAAPEGDPFAAFRAVDGPRLLDLPAVRHDPALDGDPRLVVLLPHLELGRMSGGPNTVLQLAARVAAAGVPVRCVAIAGGLDEPGAVLDHLRRISGMEVSGADVDLVAATGRRSTLAVGRGDVALATYWTTSHLARAMLDRTDASSFLTCIQDYEPGFYAWSSKGALVEATYRMPVRAIVNTRLLGAYLDHVGAGVPGDPDHRVTFLPAVDRTVFRPTSRPSGASRRLLFYARPKNPRNLFELGLLALRAAVARGVFARHPWSFTAIGQAIPDLPLSDTAQLVAQPWLPYEAYGASLGAADVLLSPMHSPHPGYPPLEMAATGGDVVTTTFGPKTAEALRELSPRIHGVEATVEALVAGLQAAVAAAEVHRGAPDGEDDAGVRLPATWDEALRDVVPWTIAQVAAVRGGA